MNSTFPRNFWHTNVQTRILNFFNWRVVQKQKRTNQKHKFAFWGDPETKRTNQKHRCAFWGDPAQKQKRTNRKHRFAFRSDPETKTDKSETQVCVLGWPLSSLKSLRFHVRPDPCPEGPTDRGQLWHEGPTKLAPFWICAPRAFGARGKYDTTHTYLRQKFPRIFTLWKCVDICSSCDQCFICVLNLAVGQLPPLRTPNFCGGIIKSPESSFIILKAIQGR